MARDLSIPILLRAEIAVVEQLRGLSQVPDDGFYFYAVLVKVWRFGSFPVRAFALIDPRDSVTPRVRNGVGCDRSPRAPDRG